MKVLLVSGATEDLAPASEVLSGVHSITGTGWRGAQTVANGGTPVAKWMSGDLLAVTGIITDANSHMRNRVDINIQPTDIASGGWTGDGIKLLRNALLYH